MKVRFAQICAGITVAVFAGITLVFVLRLTKAYEQGVQARQAEFQALSELVVAAYEAAGFSYTNIAWERFGEAFGRNPAVAAVLVRSADGRVEYLLAQDSGLLAPGVLSGIEQSTPPPLQLSEVFLPGSSARRLALSDTVRTPQGGPVQIHALYTVLPNSVIYQLLRDSLLALLGFAAFTLTASLGMYLRHTPRQDAFIPEPTEQKEQMEMPVAGEHEPARSPGHPEFLRRLTLEIERSAFNEEDLVLCLLRAPIAQAFEAQASSHQQLYEFIASEHAFKELCFELGENTIALIEPNNDIDGGLRRIENLMRKVHERAFMQESPLHAGLTARAGRLTESQRMFKEANTALRRAEKQGEPVIAFRPDPDRYRRFVATETENAAG